LICCVLLGISTVALPHYSADWRLYALAILGAFSAVLFPTWLFQGFERMRDLALMSLSTRILSVAAIFIFVRGPTDMWLATLLQVGASFVMALLAQLLAHRLLGGRVTIPSVSAIIEQLREGWAVFVGTLAINLYTTAQTVIVGTIGGAAAAGYYGAADKCLSAGKAGFGVLTQAALPKVAYYAKHDPRRGLWFIKRLTLLAPIGLVATFVMFFYPEGLVRLLFGAQFIEQVTPVFRILSPVPFIWTLSTCFATLFMFNYGYHRQWSMMIVSASCLSVVIVLGLQFVVASEQAAAWATMLSEALILVVSAIYFLQSKPS
jgi:polysaccharide transporter, PST family